VLLRVETALSPALPPAVVARNFLTYGPYRHECRAGVTSRGKCRCVCNRETRLNKMLRTHRGQKFAWQARNTPPPRVTSESSFLYRINIQLCSPLRLCPTVHSEIELIRLFTPEALSNGSLRTRIDSVVHPGGSVQRFTQNYNWFGYSLRRHCRDEQLEFNSREIHLSGPSSFPR
jgi:hypothetical protein